MRCQISSVMKGMSGCSARCSASSISRQRALRAAPGAAGAALSDCSTGLVSSRYQSQKSYQVNSYSALAAKSKR